MLNAKYGSKESFKIVEEIYSTLRDEAYRSSIEMAKERGAFSIWDHKKEVDNKFLNRLPEDIQKEMKKYGRRNIACLTGSPAGCLGENEVILTDRGAISLKNIFKVNGINIEDLDGKKDLWFDCNKTVFVYDINGNEHKIKKMYWSGLNDGYKMRLKSRDIICSKNHKFLVLSDNNTAIWKRAEDINIGEKIVKLKKE
jgi:ribonucleotide reductase alpha subunit